MKKYLSCYWIIESYPLCYWIAMQARYCVALLCMLYLRTYTYGVSYEGYYVLSVTPNSDEQLEKLKWFYMSNENGEEGVKFLESPSRLYQAVTLACDSDKYHEVSEKFIGLDVTELTADLQADIAAESTANEFVVDSGARTTHGSFNINRYNRYDKMLNYLDWLNDNCDICETFSIGESFEGRDMRGIKLATDGATEKPIVWIDAGIHAREWIAPATAIYIISKIAQEHDTDTDIAGLLDEFDWYILPVANPDGYEYSHTTDRLWRKTRSMNSGSDCIGVDPNRNWDFHWAEVEVTENPCSDTYPGSGAFSEAETRHMSSFIRSISDRMAAYFSFHSYSQAWLVPYGYTTDVRPKNYAELIRLGKLAAGAIKQDSGLQFKVGAPGDVLYLAAGGSFDWVSGVANVPYTFTPELRDTGSFILPPSNILLSGSEIWAGVKTILLDIAQNY